MTKEEVIEPTIIHPPKGYEVDEEKSTFKEIRYKKIEKRLPESWEDLANITECSSNLQASGHNRNVFTSKKLAEASIAVAQLSQLREVTRDGWEPDWKDTISLKYAITWFMNNIIIEARHGLSCFLSFQSKEIAEEFLKKYRDLIIQAKPILGE